MGDNKPAVPSTPSTPSRVGRSSSAQKILYPCWWGWVLLFSYHSADMICIIFKSYKSLLNILEYFLLFLRSQFVIGLLDWGDCWVFRLEKQIQGFEDMNETALRRDIDISLLISAGYGHGRLVVPIKFMDMSSMCEHLYFMPWWVKRGCILCYSRAEVRL